MNEKYWQEYYKNRSIQAPSDFVNFCSLRIPYGSQIIDMGAGDGRDSRYLTIRGDVLAIEPNTELPGTLPGVSQVNMTVEDFIEVHPTDLHPDVVYARWFFHSVTDETEDRVLDFVAEHKATLMAEFRILRDVPDTTHPRRLINQYEFAKKLIDRGYIINHLSIGRYSQHGENNPLLCRIVGEYKGR
jgi:hypothetical protein